MGDIQTATGAEQQGKRSIGGGLVVLAIVLLLVPIHVMAYFKTDVFPFLKSGAFSIMMDFSLTWSVLLMIEVIALPAAAACSFVLLVCLFMKKRFVPKMVVILLATLTILSILDYAANNWIADYVSQQAKEATNLRIIKYGVKMLAYSLIFIPYLLLSRNVKETFHTKETPIKEELPTPD